jgi:hypothetical protein
MKAREKATEQPTGSDEEALEDEEKPELRILPMAEEDQQVDEGGSRNSNGDL